MIGMWVRNDDGYLVDEESMKQDAKDKLELYLRENNLAVKEAWEKYQVILKLVIDHG